MYSFEGIFRNKPPQNYARTVRDTSSSLAQRNREERRKRELFRRENEAATRLQSFVRGSLTRIASKRYTREMFDHLVLEESQMRQLGNTEEQRKAYMTLIRCFNNFFNPTQDQGRLMTSCSLTVSTNLKSVVDDWLRERDSDNVYVIGRFLLKITGYLEQLERNCPSSQFTLPFRVLENILVNFQEATADNISLVVHFLARKGFFRSLAAFIDRQAMDIVDPGEYDHASFSRHPKVKSFLDVFLSPFVFADRLETLKGRGSSGALYRHLVTACVNTVYVEDRFFGYQPSPKVMKVISGALSQCIPISALATSLLQPPSGPPVTGNPPEFTLAVKPSFGLLHLLGYWMIRSHLHDLAPDEACALTVALALLLPFLTVVEPPARPLTMDGLTREDSDDEEQDRMLSTVEETEILTELRERGAQLIKTALSGEFVTEIILPVANLFHYLIQKQQLPLSVMASYTSALANNVTFLRHLWESCQTLRPQHDPSAHTYTNAAGMTGGTPLLRILSSGSLPTDKDLARFLPLASTLASCFHHRLLGLHDAEVMSGFDPKELVRMAALLRDLMTGLIELAHPDSMKSLDQDYRGVLERMQQGKGERTFRPTDLSDSEQRRRLAQWSTVFYQVQRLVVQLYSRDRRLHFCPGDHWIRPSVADGIHLDPHSWLRRAHPTPLLTRVPFGYYSLLNPDRETDDSTPMILSTREARQLTYLVEMPFVVPFEKRVKIFQSLLVYNRQSIQGTSTNPMLDEFVRVKVRRSHIYEDAFDKLSQDNEATLHPRFRVEFLNVAGAMEAGIDGGGLSREFITEVLKTGFDPTRGLFIYSTDKSLYPNPEASAITPNYLQHYFFLGRMLAKAIYEGMLVELSFAQFFLAKVLSRTGGDVDIDYLHSLDPELYRNLLYLKTYEGDVSALELDFSTMRHAFGESQVVELKPEGKNTPVTEENKVEYIHLMAHYKLNRQIRPHVNAFISGMHDVVPIDWLRLFDSSELQMLISGADMPIDVEDLKQNTVYLSGTQSDSESIHHFWAVVEDMAEHEKRSLLRFVTSCSRPPMFGFKELHPPFAVQLVHDCDRLPSSSTCMNLLKLPDFKDPNTMRRKLLYAINAGAGFELS